MGEGAGVNPRTARSTTGRPSEEAWQTASQQGCSQTQVGVGSDDTNPFLLTSGWCISKPFPILSHSVFLRLLSKHYYPHFADKKSKIWITLLKNHKIEARVHMLSDTWLLPAFSFQMRSYAPAEKQLYKAGRGGILESTGLALNPPSPLKFCLYSAGNGNPQGTDCSWNKVQSCR